MPHEYLLSELPSIIIGDLKGMDFNARGAHLKIPLIDLGFSTTTENDISSESDLRDHVLILVTDASKHSSEYRNTKVIFDMRQGVGLYDDHVVEKDSSLIFSRLPDVGVEYPSSWHYFKTNPNGNAFEIEN